MSSKTTLLLVWEAGEGGRGGASRVVGSSAPVAGGTQGDELQRLVVWGCFPA